MRNTVQLLWLYFFRLVKPLDTHKTLLHFFHDDTFIPPVRQNKRRVLEFATAVSSLWAQWEASKEPTPVSSLQLWSITSGLLYFNQELPSQRCRSLWCHMSQMRQREWQPAVDLDAGVYLKKTEIRAFTLDISHTCYLLCWHYICKVSNSLSAVKLLLAQNAWAESHAGLCCASAHNYPTWAQQPRSLVISLCFVSANSLIFRILYHFQDLSSSQDLHLLSFPAPIFQRLHLPGSICIFATAFLSGALDPSAGFSCYVQKHHG